MRAKIFSDWQPKKDVKVWGQDKEGRDLDLHGGGEA